MTKMGLHKGDGKPIDPYVSDITLGSGTTNPMSLANAYATLAASGKHCEPYAITSITTSDKKAIKVPGPQCKQVISADVADGATELLEGHASVRYGCGQLGHQRPPGRRQDRHHREAQPELVRRLHQAAGQRGVDRQPQAGQQERQAELAQRQVLR